MWLRVRAVEKVAREFVEGIYKTRIGLYNLVSVLQGGIAQLGERLHGMQEVNGSIPFTSTNPIRFSVLVPIV